VLFYWRGETCPLFGVTLGFGVLETFGGSVARVGGEERLDLEQRERTRTLIAHCEHVWRSPHVLISHTSAAAVCISHPHTVRGGADPMAFHAFRRACGFYSWYRLRPAWWAPAKSKDTAACARSFRMPPFWSERRRMSRASTKCTEVLAERHKSDCRSTAREDQQGLRVCGLEGRRSMQ
jgi:hypothetical protein